MLTFSPPGPDMKAQEPTFTFVLSPPLFSPSGGMDKEREAAIDVNFIQIIFPSPCGLHMLKVFLAFTQYY